MIELNEGEEILYEGNPVITTTITNVKQNSLEDSTPNTYLKEMILFNQKSKRYLIR